MVEDVRHVGQGLDVVDQGGLCGSARRLEEPLHIWRVQPGKRVAALDHLEEALLLAEEIVVRSGYERDFERPEKPYAGETLGSSLHARHALCELRLDADEDPGCADGEGCRCQALHDLIRVAAHDGAILEGAWLALGGVAHHEFHRRIVVGQAGPLDPGGESGAAPAPQPRGADRVEDRTWAHVATSLERRAAARGEVVLERVDRRGGQDVAHRCAPIAAGPCLADPDDPAQQAGHGSTQRVTLSPPVAPAIGVCFQITPDLPNSDSS